MYEEWSCGQIRLTLGIPLSSVGLRVLRGYASSVTPTTVIDLKRFSGLWLALLVLLLETSRILPTAYVRVRYYLLATSLSFVPSYFIQYSLLAIHFGQRTCRMLDTQRPLHNQDVMHRTTSLFPAIIDISAMFDPEFRPLPFP